MEQQLAGQQNRERERKQRENREKWKDVVFYEKIFKYDMPIISAVVGDNDAIVLYDQQNIQHINRDIATVLQDLSPEALAKGEHPGKAVVIEDKNGEQYVVQKDKTTGKTTVTKVEGGGLIFGPDGKMLNEKELRKFDKFIIASLRKYKKEIEDYLAPTKQTGKGPNLTNWEDAAKLSECLAPHADRASAIGANIASYLVVDSPEQEAFLESVTLKLAEEYFDLDPAKESETQEKTDGVVCEALVEDDEESAMSSLDITDEKYREIATEDDDHIGGLEMASEIINHLYKPDNSVQRNSNSDKKFKITVRSFLPYLYVLDPLNNPATGRNRIDLANIRDYPQYHNVGEHGGFKTEQTFIFDFSQNLVIYNTAENYRVPPTYLLDRNTNQSQKIANDESNDILTNIQNNGEPTRGINQGARYLNFLAAISAGNPAVDPSPNIDYTLGFGVREDGQYKVYGVWDGFPALEIFIEELKSGNAELVYFLSTSDARKTFKPKDIFNLIDGRGDVQINVIKQFEGGYGDNKLPYSEVRQLYQLFNVKE